MQCSIHGCFIHSSISLSATYLAMLNEETTNKSAVCFQNLIIEQQECKRQQIRSEQVEDRISGIMNKVEALEKNINKIMTALKIKH